MSIIIQPNFPAFIYLPKTIHFNNFIVVAPGVCFCVFFFHQFFWAYNCPDTIFCRLCTTETLLAGCLAAVLPLPCHSAAPQPCCPMCTPLSPCCRDHLQLTILYPVLPAFSFPYSPEVHLCHPYDFVEFQISPNSEHWATSYLPCSLATSVSCLPRPTPWIWPLTLISSIILSHIHLPSAS